MSYGNFIALLGFKKPGVLIIQPQTKIYRALLFQDGTASSPVVTVLENTIGNIVWTRNAEGIYIATLNSVFTYLKTFITFNTGNSVNGFGGAEWIDANSIRLSTYLLTSSAGPTYSDGRLSINGACIEIIVYP